MAYEEVGGWKIVEVPIDALIGEPRIPLHPIDQLYKARQILAWAKDQRPDVKWKIIGGGPYGVHGREE